MNSNYLCKLLKRTTYLTNFISVSLIVAFEYSKYLMYTTYDEFIDGVTTKLALKNMFYVKFFQALALNNNLIDDICNQKLMKFTDHTPWNYCDIDTRTLIEICDTYDLRIENNNYEKPIKSGLISLVFKAYDRKTNKPVIIKLKRRGIDDKMNNAIDELLYFVDLLSFLPIIKNYNIHNILKNATNMLLEQTDFAHEVSNMQLITNNCSELPYVKIPKVYTDATNEYPNAILMEFIEGLTINELDKSEYTNFAEQIIKFGLVTFAIHGVSHGDLHPGNILFIRDYYDDEYPYKIGVLDFGILYKVNEDFRAAFLEIFMEMFEIPSLELSNKILRSGVIDPPNAIDIIDEFDKNHILVLVSKIIDNVKRKATECNQVEIYKFISEFTDFIKKPSIRNLGLKPSESLNNAQIVLAMTHGVTLKLCGNDYLEITNKVTNELFHCDLLLDQNN